MKIDLDKMVTLTEAAEIRGVFYTAIYHLLRNGRLRSIKVAGRMLLFRDEVEKFKRSPGGRPKGSKTKKNLDRRKSK